MSNNNYIPIDTTPYEVALIAGAINDPSSWAMCKDSISPEMISSPAYRGIWNTICKMREEHKEVSILVMNTLSNNRDAIAAVMGEITRKSYREYQTVCDLLRRGYIRRQAYTIGFDLLQKAAAEDVETSELLNIPKGFEDLAKTLTPEAKDAKSIDDVIHDIADTLQEKQEDAAKGIKPRVSTGFASLDFLTYGGFNRGNLVILAARPSVGKTAVMLQMAMSAAKDGKAALCCNLEMTNEELAQRMLLATDQITYQDLATGCFDWNCFETASAYYNNNPIYMIDSFRSAEDICNKIAMAHSNGMCDVAFIDYLGLIPFSGSSKANLSQQIGDVTARLKRLAKELRIPIVLLCQLNRMSVSENRPPQLYDLRDSGSIEQDADIVIMLERPDMTSSSLVMHIRKNRQGKLDSIFLEANESYTLFHEQNKTIQNIQISQDPNPVDDMPY